MGICTVARHCDGTSYELSIWFCLEIFCRKIYKGNSVRPCESSYVCWVWPYLSDTFHTQHIQNWVRVHNQIAHDLPILFLTWKICLQPNFENWPSKTSRFKPLWYRSHEFNAPHLTQTNRFFGAVFAWFRTCKNSEWYLRNDLLQISHVSLSLCTVIWCSSRSFTVLK